MTIVLDFDGPILDGRARHYQCYADILVERGYQPVAIELYWELKRNRVDRHQLLFLSKASEIYDEFLAEWMQRIEAEHYLAMDQLQPRVPEILAAWKKQDIRLILATMRNSHHGVQWQLERFGIDRLFDQVLVSGTRQGDLGKAEAVRPFLAEGALEAVMWVGDTEVDQQAARQIGTKSCLVTCGLRSRDFLASLAPDMLEESLQSFAHSEMTKTWLNSVGTGNGH